MFFINLLDDVLPSNLANDANGSGRGLYGGTKTFLALQQLLYTIFRFPRRAPTLSPYQKKRFEITTL
jgi:hypothetical protein